MKIQAAESTMGKIICWYIKGKGSKLCQDDPKLPVDISSTTKSQDNIGWYNMLWVCIYCP